MSSCKHCKYCSYIKGNHKDIKDGCYICNVYGREIRPGEAVKCSHFKRR